MATDLEHTSSQAKFLSQTVDEVDLSVRSLNCLKNMRVKYLGELVQYSPEDLLRFPNLGRKSLNEIIDLFAKENLSLGLTLPEWTPETKEIPAIEVANTPVEPLLTRAQCAFLAKRLDDIDLSVRTSNCLSTLNISYLGELIRFTPRELMRIHAFGKKSLAELKELFASAGLSLGRHIPDWTPDFVPAGQATNTSNAQSDEDTLTSTQSAFLAQPTTKFHLSKRVATLLQLHGIVRIGDLARLSSHDARLLVGHDQAALRELSGLLGAEQLHFGTYISNWSAELASQWDDSCAADIEHIRERHALGVDGAPHSHSGRLEDELENLIRVTLKGASDRKINAAIRFFGFDGTGKKTLEEVGQEFGVTRERIRQITSNFTRRLQGKNLYLPMFRMACNYLIDHLPEVATTLAESLRQQQITKTDFDISAIAAMSEILEEEELFDIISIGRIRLAVRKESAEHCIQVPRIARAVSSAFGCGHIEHVLGDLEISPEQSVDTAEVTKVLEFVPDLKWLDPQHQWFTIVEAKRNRLSNVVRKVLAVSPKISLPELRGAIKRVHRLDGFAPPSEILKAFCLSLSFCAVSDEYVSASLPVDVGETLGDIERCFYDVLGELGPVMSLNTLRDECLRRGMNSNSFYQYITYSPIICRLAREAYALVGAEVAPGSIENLSRITVKTPVLIGHGWTGDGRAWISYRLNASNVRSGVFSLPAALKNLVQGEFSIQSSGTGSTAIVVAEDDRLTGLHRPIAIRGGQPDDVIIVTFDLRRGSAELRFGEEETSVSSEAPIDVTLPASIDAASISSDPLTPRITTDDLIGVGKDWRPISTAPVNEELEVRLEDAFGRYVLLFPCKLVAGQRWVNSRLEKPLTAEPVDWRPWDEASLHF